MNIKDVIPRASVVKLGKRAFFQKLDAIVKTRKPDAIMSYEGARWTKPKLSHAVEVGLPVGISGQKGFGGLKGDISPRPRRETHAAQGI